MGSFGRLELAPIDIDGVAQVLEGLEADTYRKDMLGAEWLRLESNSLPISKSAADSIKEIE